MKSLYLLVMTSSAAHGEWALLCKERTTLIGHSWTVLEAQDEDDHDQRQVGGIPKDRKCDVDF